MTETIKYHNDHTEKDLPEIDAFETLQKWRQLFYDHGLLMVYDLPAGPVAGGCLSYRIHPKQLGGGRNSFLVTGRQTGLKKTTGKKDYAMVIEYHPQQNTVQSEGPIPPSSESMTFGQIYDEVSDVRWAFHAHSPEIWKTGVQLGLPATDKTAEYGTPEMASAVEALFRETNVAEIRAFVMGGHEDGVMTFGTSADAAGKLMLDLQRRAREIISI